MFNPLAKAAYAKTSEAGFVDEADVVMAVDSNGEAVAYPSESWRTIIWCRMLSGARRLSPLIERSVTPVWCGKRQ